MKSNKIRMGVVVLAATLVLGVATFSAKVVNDRDTSATSTRGVGVESVPTQTAQQQPAPKPPQAGDAGLLGSTGTSMVLVLMMGIAAAALVAGAATATRER